MKRTSFSVAFLLLITACGGGTSSTTSTSTSAPAATTTTAGSVTTTAVTPTTAAPSTTTEAPAEGRLELYSVVFAAAMVVVHNGTADTVELTDYWLCQGSTCSPVPSIEMPADSYLSINAGSQVFLPIPGSLTVDGIVDLGGFDPANGEVALFSSDRVSEAEAVVSYVEWGSSGHDHSLLAIDAGLWQEGWFVATDAETSAITYQPDTSTADEAGWNVY